MRKAKTSHRLEKYFKKLFSIEGAEHYTGVVKKANKSNVIEAFVKCCDAINEKQDSKGKTTFASL